MEGEGRAAAAGRESRHPANRGIEGERRGGGRRDARAATPLTAALRESVGAAGGGTREPPTQLTAALRERIGAAGGGTREPPTQLTAALRERIGAAGREARRVASSRRIARQVATAPPR